MPVSVPIDPELHRAIDRALAGDWTAAHEIVQAREGDTMADWIHAVVHRHEGDRGNARYWYGRCGRPLPEALAIADELRAIRARLDAPA